ncbi:hypothetical protein HK102_014104 [Quaeritorhiza haematococci]|nr:hypothetical protein HK102_014104 [Quaeritorhiza haematococci]
MFSKSQNLAFLAAILYASPALAVSIPAGHYHSHLYNRGSDGVGPNVPFGYAGALGPEMWGSLTPAFETCRTGRKQSPINFEDQQMLMQQGPAFNWKAPTIQAVNMTNDGHSIEVEIPEAAQKQNNITIGELTYSLRQFHFHTPSEHHIKEKFFPMEAHFVHMTADGKIAVVGLFFEIGQQPSTFLNQLIPQFPTKKDESKILQTLDLSEVMSGLVAPFWRYEGSLTTPPCTEGVQWTVVDKPLSMTLDQWNGFRKVMTFNARPTQ